MSCIHSVLNTWESTVPCCNLLIDGEVERFPTVPFLWHEYTVKVFAIKQVWSDGDVVEAHATALN